MSNFTYNPNQKFTENWFDGMIPLWDEVFTKLKPPSSIKNILEIGCYEGRATSFLCGKYLEKDTNYYIVDTFGGTLEEEGMGRTSQILKEDKNFIYNNFTHNISFYPNINFNINKGNSRFLLPQLEEKGNKYDFIYIDASHRSDDTLNDAYYSHKMLNPGGLLIFDDFGWKDPNQPNPINSPELGILMFFEMYKDLYDINYKGYQIVATKKLETNE